MPLFFNTHSKDDPLLTSLEKKPDIYSPRWDQSTFSGRLKHFKAVVNPLNLFVSPHRLEECRKIVLDYEHGKLDEKMTLNQLWDAKHIYDSAYHPTSGEKMPMFGRMCSQVPVNSMISAGMLFSYNSTKGMIFWQWFNQSYNALINFSNRSGEEHLANSRLLCCYFAAAGGSMSAASALKNYADKLNLPSVVRRLVPFGAVALANIINVPMMRSGEFINGIPLKDEHGNTLATSTKVAFYAIPMVVVCRILMNLPDMVILPIIIDRLVKIPFIQKNKYVRYGMKITLAALAVSFATPISCAIFPQMTPCKIEYLEENVQKKLREKSITIDTVFFNKGL
uniref:Sidoreflexin n=1 Tax=Parastrongyloides trichosuri TaxID=131310 RepID=A0A0N4ZN66_PARTI